MITRDNQMKKGGILEPSTVADKDIQSTTKAFQNKTTLW